MIESNELSPTYMKSDHIDPIGRFQYSLFVVGYCKISPHDLGITRRGSSLESNVLTKKNLASTFLKGKDEAIRYFGG